MRYNPGDEDRPTVASIVNGRNEAELADIIYRYGEERLSRRIAKKIVGRRRERRIGTPDELAEIIQRRSQELRAVASIPQRELSSSSDICERRVGELGEYFEKPSGNNRKGRSSRDYIVSFAGRPHGQAMLSNLVKEKKARFIIKNQRQPAGKKAKQTQVARPN